MSNELERMWKEVVIDRLMQGINYLFRPLVRNFYSMIANLKSPKVTSICKAVDG
jgi:hypothetical protein